MGGVWKSDLVMGAGNWTAVATLMERKSRFLIIRRVEGPKCALWVQRNMTQFFRTLPQQLRGSLMWDRGSEMNRYGHLTSATEMAVPVKG